MTAQEKLLPSAYITAEFATGDFDFDQEYVVDLFAGTTKILKLVCQNFTQLRQNMPATSFLSPPKTFQKRRM